MKMINLGTTILKTAEQMPQYEAGAVSARRIQPQQLSLPGAQSLTSFPIRQLSVPNEVVADLTLDRVMIFNGGSAENPTVFSVLLRYQSESGQWVALQQSLIPQNNAVRPIILYTDDLASSSVFGRPAAVYSHTVEAWNLPSGQLTITHCVWEDGPLLLDLQGPLSQEHLIFLAENTR